MVPFLLMAKFEKKDIAGQKFGLLTAMEIAHQHSCGSYYWLCQCECGEFSLVMATKLIRGKTKSCGCLKHKKGQNATHGLKSHPMYSVWRGIKYRCLNENSQNYRSYGGRGITICDEWKESFQVFYNDMKDGYVKGLQIGRIENDKGYSKDNCRWETNIENQNNKRTNVFLTLDGETHTAAEWSRILHIKDNTIQTRKRKGNTDKQSLFGRIRIPVERMQLSINNKKSRQEPENCA